MASVLDQILDTVVTKIRALDLVGMPDASVQRLKCILDRDFPTPGIGVAVLGPEEISETGPNQKDDVTYNIGVCIKVADNQDQKSNNEGESQFMWRHRIRRRFSHQGGSEFAFTAITEACTCSVKPLDIIDLRNWTEFNLLTSSLLLCVQCREGRSYS